MISSAKYHLVVKERDELLEAFALSKNERIQAVLDRKALEKEKEIFRRERAEFEREKRILRRKVDTLQSQLAEWVSSV